ncbi:hypothetical protein [Fulvimonas yonginensis]|uniref:Uncharacterized protein n=1 Tax=Fulvimonas yonginensis TaxID=1495200 RepID=A0ABU8JG35_9GAMM
MMILEFGKPAVCKLATLAPMQLFVHGKGSALSTAIFIEGGQGALWLNLSGEAAFQFGEVKLVPGAGYNVLAMRPPTPLKVLVDPSSGVDPAKAAPGQLLISGDYGPCIAGSWPKNDSETNSLSLQHGHVVEVTHPLFAFESWSLGYEASDGGWVDIVSREKPST